MSVIKSANIPSSTQPFSMHDIEDAAKRILLRARRQAEQMLIEAQKEGEALKKAAQAEGLEAGRAEGTARGLADGKKAGQDAALAETRASLAELLKTFTSVVQSVEASRTALEADALREVIDLAIAIAERVTKRQGVLDGEVVAANVAEAMKLVVHAADLRIAVNPKQRATLMEVLPRLQMQWPVLQHVELLDDAALAAGGCRIYSKNGCVDADLDGQLRRIAEELVPQSEEVPQ